MTYEEAVEKADKMVKENGKRIYFIMGKNNSFDVFTGWDGRDKAKKNGYVFPRYSLSRREYITDFDVIASRKFGDFCD